MRPHHILAQWRADEREERFWMALTMCPEPPGTLQGKAGRPPLYQKQFVQNDTTKR